MTLEKYNEINKKTIVHMNNKEAMITSTHRFIDDIEKREFIDMYMWMKNTKKAKNTGN
ncbi:MAG: hypothetical protein Q9M43_09980 [Sulfurimonas sp.]|nr:hypothetical protein [Sulfurimonas sp.]